VEVLTKAQIQELRNGPIWQCPDKHNWWLWYSGEGDSAEELTKNAHFKRDTLRSSRDDFGYKPGTRVDTPFKEAQCRAYTHSVMMRARRIMIEAGHVPTSMRHTKDVGRWQRRSSSIVRR